MTHIESGLELFFSNVMIYANTCEQQYIIKYHYSSYTYVIFYILRHLQQNDTQSDQFIYIAPFLSFFGNRKSNRTDTGCAGS